MKNVARFTVILAIAGPVPVAMAGTISTGVVSGDGGTATIVRNTVGVVDFNVVKTFTQLTPIDITFDVTTGSNPLGFFDFSERIVNATGRTWFDFHLELGTGTGDAFRAIDSTSQLRFTQGPVPSECSSPQTNFAVGLGANCGLMPFGGSAGQQTTMDFLSTSPDITAPNANGIEAGHQLNLAFQLQVPNGLANFTLREIPTVDGKVRPRTVPEPETLALLTVCSVGIGIAYLRKRRAAGATARSHAIEQ